MTAEKRTNFKLEKSYHGRRSKQKLKLPNGLSETVIYETPETLIAVSTKVRL